MINASLGKYYYGESLIHRLDPRTKIISLISILISISIVKSIYGFIIISLVVISEIVISQVPIRLIFQYIRPMIWLFLSIFLFHILFTDADDGIIFSFGLIKATTKGLYNGLLICYRLFIVVLCSSILILTTMPIHLADGIAEFLKPLRKIKIHVEQIPIMLMITLRFIPILFSEGEKLISLQKLRGLKYSDSGFFKKMFYISLLIVPLMRNSFRMADELAMGMESRCYNGETRSHLYELSFRKADYISIFISVFVMAFVIILDYLRLL